MEEGVVLLWLAFCVGVGALASSRGRNPVVWFLLAVLISPLLAGIIVLVMKDEKHEKLRSRAIHRQRLQDRRRIQEEREERRQLEEERRQERMQAQQMHAALISRLSDQPRQADYSQAPTPRSIPAVTGTAAAPPPLPEELNAPAWYVVLDGQKLGPLSIGQLAQLAKEKRIKKDTRVWGAGMAQWSTIGQVPGLLEAIRRAAGG